MGVKEAVKARKQDGTLESVVGVFMIGMLTAGLIIFVLQLCISIVFPAVNYIGETCMFEVWQGNGTHGYNVRLFNMTYNGRELTECEILEAACKDNFMYPEMDCRYIDKDSVCLCRIG